MLPQSVPILFGGLEASLSLPRGLLSIVIVVLALIVPLFLFFGKKGGSQSVVSAKRRDVILLMGECGAGKTIMFHQLAAGVVPETVSSLAAEERVTKLFVDADDSSATKYRLVDQPGHHRLSRAPFRSLATHMLALKGLVVVIDSTDSRSSYLRDVAELLYDLLTHAPVADATPGIFIACNKQDLPGAAGPDAIRKRLEEELEKLKVSKVAVSATGDTTEKILLGVPGQAFTFASDAPNVSFGTCSAKAGKLDSVVEFIHSC